MYLYYVVAIIQEMLEFKFKSHYLKLIAPGGMAETNATLYCRDMVLPIYLRSLIFHIQCLFITLSSLFLPSILLCSVQFPCHYLCLYDCTTHCLLHLLSFKFTIILFFSLLKVFFPSLMRFLFYFL